MAEDQHGIDFIANLFAGEDNGFLVDVGAHDGIGVGSMTARFIADGWSGLMIEPLTEAFAKLRAAYKDNSKVICLECACSNHDGEAQLYPHRGVSTINPQWAKACANYWGHVNYGKPYTVQVRMLVTILDALRRQGRVNGRVDYLQIDTEGHDLEVLQGMDWTLLPRVICVETLDMTNLDARLPGGKWKPRQELDNYLRDRGYCLRMLTKGGNGIYTRAGEQ